MNIAINKRVIPKGINGIPQPYYWYKLLNGFQIYYDTNTKLSSSIKIRIYHIKWNTSQLIGV